MRMYVRLLFISFPFFAIAQIHELTFYNVCFKTYGMTGLQIDGEDVLFFDDMDPIFEFPSFINTSTLVLPDYKLLNNRSTCLSKIRTLIDEEVNITATEDPPETTIYTADPAEPGLENTLICFVNHFHPPSITVRWMKNNVAITEGVNETHYYGHADGTFHMFSHLSFVPEEGDIYGCIVEHQALKQPSTQIWALPVQESEVGPSVLCGVGVTLGLIGMTSGIFLLIKGWKHPCDH